jgi:hypothetical protein
MHGCVTKVAVMVAGCCAPDRRCSMQEDHKGWRQQRLALWYGEMNKTGVMKGQQNVLSSGGPGQLTEVYRLVQDCCRDAGMCSIQAAAPLTMILCV